MGMDLHDQLTKNVEKLSNGYQRRWLGYYENDKGEQITEEEYNRVKRKLIIEKL